MELEIPKQSLGEIIFWSVNDISPIARKVLLHHLPDTRPLHVFGDILLRLHDQDLQNLLCIEKAHFALLAELTSNWDDAQPKSKFADEKSKLGRALVAAYAEYLERVDFKKMVHCYACGGECPIFPPQQFRHLRWIEVAGSSCQACSKANQKAHRLLHRSTLVLMTWAFSLRSARPDQVLHE